MAVQLRLADARLQDEARRTQADMAQMYQHCDEFDDDRRRTMKRQSPTPDTRDADADDTANLKRPQGYYSLFH